MQINARRVPGLKRISKTTPLRVVGRFLVSGFVITDITDEFNSGSDCSGPFPAFQILIKHDQTPIIDVAKKSGVTIVISVTKKAFFNRRLTSDGPLI